MTWSTCGGQALLTDIIPCDRGLFNLFTVGITVAYTVLAMVMTVLMIQVIVYCIKPEDGGIMV